MKKKSGPNSIPKKEAATNTLAEPIARLKAHREAVGKKLFPDYDLALVALVAAHVSREHKEPEDAARTALQILDACERERSARSRKLKAILNAPVDVYATQCSFEDGIRAITRQRRSARAEEYFQKFLVAEVGSKIAADQLKRLKRDGFTIDEIPNYESRYARFRPPRKQKT